MTDDTETLAQRATRLMYDLGPMGCLGDEAKIVIPALVDANARLERERDEMRSTAAGVTLAMTKQRDAATAALAKAEGERDLFKSLCSEFVRRVEAGEIRSRKTYAAMKAALTPAPEAPKDGE